MSGNRPYDLVLFTSHFPYEKGETFLAAELEHLARSFDRIAIFPLTGTGAPRPVPGNCEVIPPLFSTRADVLLRGLANTSAPLDLARDFASERVWADPVKLRRFIPATLFVRRILSHRRLRNVLENRITPSTVLYFYWSVGFAYAAHLLPCRENPMVARFHGSDLYEEAWHGYTPLRARLIDRLDRLVFVSRDGLDYIRSRHPSLEDERLALQRLGTIDHGLGPRPDRGAGEPFRLVTCSNLKPVKRVDLLLDALGHLGDLPIELVCIGDGPQREALERKAERLPGSVTPRFTGWMQSDALIDYYSSTPVDLFVNTSSSEGIPVTIMEAMSFGIPVVASAVGGVPEIVDSSVGALFPPDADERMIAATIRDVCTLETRRSRSLRDAARERWKNLFDADSNYQKMATLLKDLAEGGPTDQTSSES